MSSLSLTNIEVLAYAEDSDGGGNSKWFSNLNWVECTVTKVNAGGGMYIKGVWVAAGGTYTVYGNKKACERELTTNSCNTSDQTPCTSID